MYLPLMLDMTGQPVLCVGAGPVAAGKLRPFVAAGAAVVVIAPEVSAAMAVLVEGAPGLSGTVQVIRRRFVAADLDRNPRVVIAATAEPAIDEEVSTAADARGIWCLRVDGGEAGSPVALPAIVREQGVTLALTTGVPALSRRLRMDLEAVLADEWGPAAAALAGLRRDPALQEHLAALPAEERRDRWRSAVDAALEAIGRTAPPAPERLAALAREILLA